MKDGNYECLCPLGKTGQFCREEMFISDPLFLGDASFMSLTLDSAIRFNTEISLDIRPDALDGLLVHFGQTRDARHQDYFSIMLRNGSVFLSFSLGGPRGGQSHALTLSLCCVKVGMWHKIQAGRSGRDGYLMLDSQQTMGNAPPGKSQNLKKIIVIDRNPILYFWPNQNQNRNAVTETESKPKVNGKY